MSPYRRGRLRPPLRYRVRPRLGHRSRLRGRIAWQSPGKDPEARERTALKVIAVSIFALAAYIVVESVRSLFGAEAAEHSTVGIVLAAVSLVVMPFLSYAQRRAGRELARPAQLPTPNRLCYAPTCRAFFYSGCC